MTSQRYTPDIIARAEEILSRVQGISSCRISTDETGAITEVHVVATAHKSPKLVARDVETCLLAELGISVDHRKIGVVVFEPPQATETAPDESPGPTVRADAQESGPSASEPKKGEPIVEFAVEEYPARFVFQSVNLFISQDSMQAEVELVRSGVETFGSAKSENMAVSPHRVVAEATLNAIGELLDETVRLCLADVLEVALGDGVAVVVKVDLIRNREIKGFVGCSLHSGDGHQTAVYATLDAVNRVLGVLRTKESVEYKIK